MMRKYSCEALSIPTKFGTSLFFIKKFVAKTLQAPPLKRIQNPGFREPCYFGAAVAAFLRAAGFLAAGAFFSRGSNSKVTLPSSILR